MEKKHIEFVAEIKADGADKGLITGYGSIFGNVDSHGDIVMPGAFDKSLSRRMPKMLWSHDQSFPIGVWKSAKVDGNGLRLEGEINLDVQKGREAYSLLKQGAFDGMSIGYRAGKIDYNKEGNRLLSEIDLFEVSLVSLPANESAIITSVKSLPETEREFEQFLRDAGYSRNQAKAIVAKGFRTSAMEQREAVDDDVKSGLQKAISILQEMTRNGERGS